MSNKSSDSSLGAFLKALCEEKIDCILIGMMAAIEHRKSSIGRIEGQMIRILPLERIIASKRASNRDKDILALPILERTLRLSYRLKGKD